MSKVFHDTWHKARKSENHDPNPILESLPLRSCQNTTVVRSYGLSSSCQFVQWFILLKQANLCLFANVYVANASTNLLPTRLLILDSTKIQPDINGVMLLTEEARNQLSEFLHRNKQNNNFGPHKHCYSSCGAH